MQNEAIIEHCDAFLREYYDKSIEKEKNYLSTTNTKSWKTWGFNTEENFSFYHCHLKMVTPFTNSHVWEVVRDLPVFFADHNKFKPSYVIEQLCGNASTSAGNEYRISIVDQDYNERLQYVFKTLTMKNIKLNTRQMDFRIERAGPWGGEMAELVIIPLSNHALNGMTSICIVAHPIASNNNIKVTIDCCEIMQHAWLPDLMARYPIRFLNWKKIFNRLCEIIQAMSYGTHFNENSWNAKKISELPKECFGLTKLHPTLNSFMKKHPTRCPDLS